MTDATDNVVTGPWDRDETLRRLAAMSPISYEQARKNAAKSLGVRATALDREVASMRRLRVTQDGQPPWILADNGTILPIFANAVTALRSYGFDLSFSQFSHRPFYNGAPIEDGMLLQIANEVQHYGVYAQKKVIDEAVFMVAADKQFHEVRDWLEALQWDGIDRISKILVDHAHGEDTPITRAFVEKWMIQSVARIYEPGCQADAMLVLEGRQGEGKSTFFRVIFGDKWFTDHLPDLHNKDAMIQLLGIWCIELGELATLGRSEAETQKRFLTSRSDRYRLPWDRMATDHPRQCTFAGSTNKSDYLKDETGARRFWPVKVKEVDTAAIERNREQYWAEAVHRYKAGEIWHLPKGDLAAAAKLTQSHRYKRDVWHEPVEKFIHGKPYVSIQDVLRDGILMSATADWSQREENRVSAVLSHLGWERVQRRIDGKQRYVYIPTVEQDYGADDEEYENLQKQAEFHLLREME